jgi:hypothetical protein
MCDFIARRYIVFIIGTERATRRKKRNSMSRKLEVTIDKTLCFRNGLMAAKKIGGDPETDGDSDFVSTGEKERLGATEKCLSS